MDSHMRRQPAERALHVKRRPKMPAQWENPGKNLAARSGPGPVNNVGAPPLLPIASTTSMTASTTAKPSTSTAKATTLTSQTSLTVATITTSLAPGTGSTTAITRSSTTISTSSISSTSSTSSSSSTTSSTPTTILPPTTSKAPAASTSVMVVPNPSPSRTPNPHDSATSGAANKGLSGSALGAIVALAVIAALGLIVFSVRKRYLRRRERRRNTWGAGAYSKPLYDTDGDYARINDKPVPTSPAQAPLSPFDMHGPSVYTSSVTPPPLSSQLMHSPASYTSFPSAPPPSYNNPIMPSTFGAPSHRPDATAVVGIARAAAGSSPQPPSPPITRMPSLSRDETTVKCAFIPTLPDELSITTGERVKVVMRFDDGWAMCANARGEQGMVPQECLEDSPMEDQGSSEMSHDDRRNVRRNSSLIPAGDRMY